VLVAGNWKMHHDHLQAIRTVQELHLRLTPEALARVEVVVHPPFTDLRSVQTVLEDRAIPVGLGAQHCHPEDSGAFTGEVAAPMLARLGVRYVLVGHSERRTLFGQTDEQVAATVRAVLKHQMVPVLCVGEQAEEREEGQTDEVVGGQVRAAITGVPADQLGGLVVAYEPVWAIGSGATPTADDVQAAAAMVRQVVGEVAGEAVAGTCRILYGGSVNADNTADLVGGPDVDGVLVGGASLQAESLAGIAAAASAAVLAASGRRR
jgi:triosephosphate isomerase